MTTSDDARIPAEQLRRAWPGRQGDGAGNWGGVETGPPSDAREEDLQRCENEPRRRGASWRWGDGSGRPAMAGPRASATSKVKVETCKVCILIASFVFIRGVRNCSFVYNPAFWFQALRSSRHRCTELGQVIITEGYVVALTQFRTNLLGGKSLQAGLLKPEVGFVTWNIFTWMQRTITTSVYVFFLKKLGV